MIGAPPAGVRLLCLLRGRSPRRVLADAYRLFRRWAWFREVMIVYRLEPAAVTPGEADDLAWRLDAVEDFALYTGSDWRIPAKAMMAEALRRRDRGDHSFTVVEDGVLVHYGWIQIDAPAIEFPEIGAAMALPPRSGVIYDVYTEPRARGRGLQRRGARRRVRLAFALGAAQVFTGVVESNVPSRRATEGAGYRAVARLVTVHRLGRRRTWEEPPVEAACGGRRAPPQPQPAPVPAPLTRTNATA